VLGQRLPSISIDWHSVQCYGTRLELGDVSLPRPVKRRPPNLGGFERFGHFVANFQDSDVHQLEFDGVSAFNRGQSHRRSELTEECVRSI
jgi:hypothetical protein